MFKSLATAVVLSLTVLGGVQAQAQFMASKVPITLTNRQVYQADGTWAHAIDNPFGIAQPAQ